MSLKNINLKVFGGVYYFHSWQKDLKYFRDQHISMDSKTILGISFTTVFILSIISAVTAIQADAMFKIKHLPEFKTTKSESIEKVESKITNLKTDLKNLNEDIEFSESSNLNKQLKN